MVDRVECSDVPGDDPAIIGSGPTVPDPTRKKDALAILERYRVPVPAGVSAWLSAPDEDRAIVSKAIGTRVIVSPHQSFMAARRKAEEDAGKFRPR